MTIIRPRKDGVGFYRACPKCEAELDVAAGEWVPALPSRTIHGYRISQLISSKVDPGEIARRRSEWKPPAPKYTTGVFAKYVKLVSSAAEGAVTG